MLLRPREKRQILDLSIQIDNNNIECVKETIFLGVTFLVFIEKYQINRNYLPLNFLPSQNLLTLFVLQSSFLVLKILCLLFQAMYIRIRQEISAFFVYLTAELIFENFEYGFKVLTRQLVKFVLSQVYPLLSYILPLTFSFLFFTCKINPFFLHHP